MVDRICLWEMEDIPFRFLISHHSPIPTTTPWRKLCRDHHSTSYRFLRLKRVTGPLSPWVIYRPMCINHYHVVRGSGLHGLLMLHTITPITITMPMKTLSPSWVTESLNQVGNHNLGSGFSSHWVGGWICFVVRFMNDWLWESSWVCESIGFMPLCRTLSHLTRPSISAHSPPPLEWS